MHCMYKYQKKKKRLPLACSDAALGLSYFCVSQPLPFTLQCGAAGGLEHSLPQAGACAWVIAANWSISDSISGHPLSPALGLSKCAYALPEKSQAFHSLPIIPTGPPSRQGGLSSLCQTPGLWCPIFWVKPLTPQERYLPTLHVQCSLSLRPLPESQVPTQQLLLLSFYLILCGSYL